MAYVMSIQFVYYDFNVFNISKISYDQFHKDFLLNLQINFISLLCIQRNKEFIQWNKEFIRAAGVYLLHKKYLFWCNFCTVINKLIKLNQDDKNMLHLKLVVIQILTFIRSILREINNSCWCFTSNYF